MIIFNNKYTLNLTRMMTPILSLLYLPHLFFLYTSGKRETIKNDLKNTLAVYSIRNISLLVGFLWAIRYNPYFVSLFYYRIGQTRAFICSLTKRDRSTLDIACDNLGSVTMYHPFGTILNAESIGDNFEFRNNITIGNKSPEQNFHRPKIGNNVKVGANAVIFGNIEIGDNVIIGAGAVVNKSIPSNCIVAGNPASIIKKL